MTLPGTARIKWTFFIAETYGGNKLPGRASTPTNDGFVIDVVKTISLSYVGVKRTYLYNYVRDGGNRERDERR